jgi:4-amino-4-deoxy-L-arabinose transferase-like glycosyltransferase
MVAKEIGPTAGLAAVSALATMPRFFFHAHLAALDVPAATGVFITVFLFWYTKKTLSPKADILLGITWGLALSTKINAVLVMPILLLWILFFCRRTYLLRRIGGMVIVGVIVFLAVWPWLYHESLPRLIEYILFVTVDHWKIGQFYLGQLYMPPPWHFPFVITLAVVPLSVTLLYILGFWRTRVQKHLKSFGGLLALCSLLPLTALSTGKSMVYDNERLFMPIFPYLAALAGIGFDWVLTGVLQLLSRSDKSIQRLATSAVAALIFLPHVVLAADLYPHLLSYYSEAIGGLSGAVRLGLETTYWCETYGKALPYLLIRA